MDLMDVERLNKIDANNRKARAILGCIVRAVQFSDEAEIDMGEMVQAAYDYVDRNDKLLGGSQ
ncbi:MAG: hypothetical protein LUG93_10170 [Lachnospiraceae bacterium]|nr:hypothetical protein [Lachnospiraceae bacterium]